MIRPWILAAVAVAVAALAATGGLILGLWWLTFAAAVVLGAIVPRTWLALAAGAAAGLVSWGAILFGENAQFGLKATALALAAILRAPGAALIPVALSLIVGTLLGLTGAWLGAAARGVLAARVRLSEHHAEAGDGRVPDDARPDRPSAVEEVAKR